MKTKIVFRTTIFILLLGFVLLRAGIAPAQEEEAVLKGSLELNRERSDSLAQGAIHTYTLSLQADRFVYGEVNQITVDVVVTIKDPDGKILRNFDGPGQGPEPFQFDSKDAGEYRIEVKPFREASGRYTIELKGLEPSAKDPKKRVDQLMTTLTGPDKPGVAVAVMKKGKVIFEKAYGMANLTHHIPFTTETLNNIGSTSKQFTAFAVLLLAKQGKLSIDDDIRKHIPELKDFGKTVTLRNLLTHTSGYREFLNLLALGGLNLPEGDYIYRDEIIEIVQRQPALQNDPGAEWNYNNTGFSLLAMVVERVTEQPFPEWMRENVFKPIGMNHTVVRVHPRQVIPNSSHGYMVGEEGAIIEGRDIASAMGAGGIYSTVGDLAKWINNLRTGKVGGKEIIGQMTTRFVLINGDTTNYGFGLFIDKHRGLNRVQHGGADMAHRSMLAYYPDIDAGYTTQSNSAAFPSGMSDSIAETFFGEYMESAEGEMTEAIQAAPFNPEAYDPEKFDVFAGRYELEEMPGFVLTFSREDSTLFIQATGQPKTEIVPVSDSTFKITVVEASVTFHRNQENRVESLTLHQNGDHLARRLHTEPYQPTQEELLGYTGRFFSNELETFYTLAVEDSALVVQHKRMRDIKLTPSKVDTFTATFPIQELIFIRDDVGDMTGLKVSNDRTRDVQFEKQE